MNLATELQDVPDTPDIGQPAARDWETLAGQYPRTSLADLPEPAPEEELIRHRFVCRGSGNLIVGPTGIGKSSLILQFMMRWGIGLSCFGLDPTRPLRSLLVQAENDPGDLIEMRDGVLAGLRFTEHETSCALNAVEIIHCNDRTRTGFLALLERWLEQAKPDLLWIDPLFAFLGADVSDQAAVSLFLRNGLNPLLTRFGCAEFTVHHTNKPPAGREKPDWAGPDFAYLGSGSGEIANWARAVLALRALGLHDVFELRLGKRGGRVGWTEEDGETRRYSTLLAHAREPGVICWRTPEPDELPQAPGRKPQHDVDDLLAALKGHCLSTAEWQKRAKEEQGVSERSFYRLLKEVKRDKRALQGKDDSKWLLP